MDVIIHKEEFVGIIFYWETEDWVYLEHFAICPEFRSRGYGKEALELLKNKGKRIVLEIEKPESDLTYRRYGFYKRNGFTMNPYYHIQAKYHVGDEDLELKILTWPDVFTQKQYADFQDYMTKNIGIRP